MEQVAEWRAEKKALEVKQDTGWPTKAPIPVPRCWDDAIDVEEHCQPLLNSVTLSAHLQEVREEKRKNQLLYEKEMRENKLKFDDYLANTEALERKLTSAAEQASQRSQGNTHPKTPYIPAEEAFEQAGASLKEFHEGLAEIIAREERKAKMKRAAPKPKAKHRTKKQTKANPKTKTKTKPKPKSPAVPLPYRLTVWTPSDLMGEEGQTVAFPSKMEAFAAFRDLQRQNLAGRALIRWFGQELMRYDGLASDEIEWNDKKPNPFRLTLWVMSDKLRENGQTLSFNTKIEAYAAFKDLRNQDLGVVCAVMTEDGDDIMRWDVMTDDDVHWTMEEAEADALDQAYAGISARTIALR